MRNLLFIIPILILLGSCSPQREVIQIPVETVKLEYVHDTKVDSIFVRDSIDRWMRGDTIFIYKEHTKYKYRDRTDTILRIDTIPSIVNVEVIKEVEVNHIKWYQKVLMWLGGITAILSTAYVIYKIKK